VLQADEYQIVGEVLGYGTPDTLEITIINEASAFYSATVKDSDNQPLDSVYVSADGADDTFTNSAGKFTLRFTSLHYPPGPPIAYPAVTYIHPDYEVYTDIIMLTEGDSITGPDVILTYKNIFTVSGNIKYDNNEPVPGAFISFYDVDGSSWQYTSSDPEGNYSIQVYQGSYYVYAWVNYHIGNAWTYRQKYYNNKSDLCEADVLEVNEKIDQVNFTFPVLQQGSISGKVIDANTQQPLSDVWISVSSAEPGDSSFTGTDQDGNYYIEVFEGDYFLFADKIGYYIQFYKDAHNVFDATPVTVNGEYLNAAGINFNLLPPEPGTNIIRGTVKDETGMLVPNVQVCAIPLAGGTWIETKSNYYGNYVLTNIKNGEYILLFYNEEYVSEFYDNVFEWEGASILNLRGDEDITVNDVYLKPLEPFGGEISGKISSGSGSALSGTLISAVNSSDEVVSSSLSLHNGNYKIPSLANGEYTIKASRIGYITSEYSGKIVIDLTGQLVFDGIDISISITGIEGDDKTIPESYILSRNFPNPFNPVTKIKYGLPQESEVKLFIYNMLGEKAAEIVNEFQKAGRYEVEWNAVDFTSGIYFCSIKAGNFSAVQKLVLVK